MSGYETAAKEVMPAVRLRIARELKARYNMKEQEIAKRLSIAQASVSKYLNGKYSDKVETLAKKIDMKYIDAYIRQISEGKEEYAQICICRVCKSVNDFGCKFPHTEK